MKAYLAAAVIAGSVPLFANELCSSLGATEGATWLEFSSLETEDRNLIVRTSGELFLGPSFTALCPPGYGLSRSRPPLLSDCFQLNIDWRNIGIPASEGDRILRQWAGHEVEVAGTLAVTPLSWMERILGREYVGSIRDVFGIQLLSAPPAAAYCIGVSVPSVSSAWEERSLPIGSDRPLCSLARANRGPEEGYCIDLARPIVWRIDSLLGFENQATDSPSTKLPFAVPRPFSPRDVVELSVADENYFFFTLHTGDLFSFDGSSVQFVRSRFVDLLTYDRDEWIYYRVRDMSPMRTVVSNSIERVNATGLAETVWSSDTDEVIFFRLRESKELELSLITSSGRWIGPISERGRRQER